jgi:hypothetical protein
MMERQYYIHFIKGEVDDNSDFDNEHENEQSTYGCMLVFEGKVDQNCTVLGSRYHCDKNKH